MVLHILRESTLVVQQYHYEAETFSDKEVEIVNFSGGAMDEGNKGEQGG